MTHKSKYVIFLIIKKNNKKILMIKDNINNNSKFKEMKLKKI